MYIPSGKVEATTSTYKFKMQIEEAETREATPQKLSLPGEEGSEREEEGRGEEQRPEEDEEGTEAPEVSAEEEGGERKEGGEEDEGEEKEGLD